MIIITGAAGFIGSCIVKKLNEEGYRNLILVDDFEREDKNRNLRGKAFIARIPRGVFPSWLDRMHADVEMVFHIGARTDTAETDVRIFDELNLHYSQALWKQCAEYRLPLIYASSAATYGLGEQGYEDDHARIEQLQPLNPYGQSKQDFDRWALKEKNKPPYWVGLKFFNVYGPNEYHKGRMASVIFHTVKQIRESGKMNLFRSHRSDIRDGDQKRDFIYVKDVVNVLWFLFRKRVPNGLYNLGTGTARSFLDLAGLTFRALDLEPDIQFIDTPADIRDTYQYFTEANMKKLLTAGYDQAFYSLEEGIEDYVREYLGKDRYF